MAAERWTVNGPQTIELDGVVALSVHLIDGRVDVVAHDDPVTRVEVHAVDGRAVEVRLDDDGRLAVGHEPLLGWKSFVESFSDFTGRGRADVHVAVPRRVPVTVGTVRGEALVAGSQADAKARTVSGSVLVTDVVGSLEASTVSGDVTVRAHRGDVGTHSVSGHVTVTGRPDAVDANTVSGDITLDFHAQPRLVRTNSVSGSVVVRVPDTTAVEARLTGVGGRLVVDAVEATGFGTKALRPRGNAATKVEAVSVSGDVTVIGTVAEAVG